MILLQCTISRKGMATGCAFCHACKCFLNYLFSLLIDFFGLQAFIERANENLKEKSDKMSSFSYKQQFAVVVICKDEKEQERIYNELKEKGHKLKVVSV